MHICYLKLPCHSPNVKVFFSILFDHLSLENCEDERSVGFDRYINGDGVLFGEEDVHE
jgi:hypothetical protein